MPSENSISINGNIFSFEPGETILEVAHRNSIDIPTLCHLKGAIPTGACRMCVVEVKGARSLDRGKPSWRWRIATVLISRPSVTSKGPPLPVRAVCAW
jgi:NADH dehydrogenase/NADH:ubiquinone oxidoreductase subunit G